MKSESRIGRIAYKTEHHGGFVSYPINDQVEENDADCKGPYARPE